MWLSVAQKWRRQKFPKINNMLQWSSGPILSNWDLPPFHTFTPHLYSRQENVVWHEADSSISAILACFNTLCLKRQIFAKCLPSLTPQKLRRNGGFFYVPMQGQPWLQHLAFLCLKHKHLDCVGARGHEVKRSCRYSTFLEKEKKNKGPLYLKPGYEFRNINLDLHFTTFWQCVDWELGIGLGNGNCMVHNLRDSAAFPTLFMLVLHIKSKHLSFTTKYMIRTQTNNDNSWF